MELERAAAADAAAMVVERGGTATECARAQGGWSVQCLTRTGRVRWRDWIANVVCTEGKNVMMDAAFGGTGSVAYVGLISSVGYTGVAASDSAAQINGANGWKEAGGANLPSYLGTRPAAVWNAASANAKSFSSPATFGISGNGTVKGMFLVYGSAATSAKDSTAGFLWSAGLFSQGDKAVGNGDTVNASYQTSL